jgi:hypothetical protein
MASIRTPYPRKPSKKINPADVPIIWRRIQRGEFLNRIAADYDVNPARISEIKAGKLFAEFRPKMG